MHAWRKHRKQNYVYSSGGGFPAQKKPIRAALLLTLAALCLFLTGAAMFLKNISCRIAVSDASDIVTVQINNAIAEVMAEQEYDEESFVRFEKNAAGEVTAISSNMARINALSADGPMRAPYIAYMQGGLTYESGKLGIMMAVSAMLDRKD